LDMRSMQQHYLPPAGSVEPLLRDAPWAECRKHPALLGLLGAAVGAVGAVSA
jgi:hypothetical protein